VSYRFGRDFDSPGAYIHLLIPDDPEEPARRAARQAEREHKAAERARERAEHAAEREAERAAKATMRSESERQASEWRAAGRCARCGAALPAPEGPGRRRIYCDSCRPADGGVAGAGRTYANVRCPYCSAALDPLPATDAACPNCRQPIHLRTGPDGLTYLLETVDLATMEAAWSEHLEARPDAVSMGDGTP
jgi:hypothetical protein